MQNRMWKKGLLQHYIECLNVERLKEIPSSRIFVEGFKTYYNFIRPHQALNGKTPAEMAGINLNLDGNKWMNIIRESWRME